MNKYLRISLLIVAALALLLVLGYISLRLFFNLIINNRSCEHFNIDHVEIHAEIDIPQIVDDSCFCKAFENCKQNRFQLRLSSARMSEYIQVNNLSRVADREKLITQNLLMPEPIYPQHQYFFRSGKYKEERWKILLDSNAQLLWVTIWYGKKS